MKKLIAFFLVTMVLSCSTEDRENQNVAPSAVSSESVLDGKLLSFKDEESFVKEYSALTEFKTVKELQDWVSKKKHSSFLNLKETSLDKEDSIFDTSKIIYSDAIKAIFNSESKVKINGNVIWLEGNKFYKLSGEDFDANVEELKQKEGELEEYGTLYNGIQSEKNKTSRVVMPVVNGATVYYSNEAKGKRYNSVLFVESIGLGASRVVKLFLKSTADYRSCSFWRCRWKNDASLLRLVTINVPFTVGNCEWSSSIQYGEVRNVVGEQTILLATKNGVNTAPCALDVQIGLTGSIRTVGLSDYVWDLVL
ncbi:hypothetical protein ACHRVW_06875 [Flavobacterium collinsii]|uniref:hypothetical protein n=1 Tax=Flavobacterium collinsii TaxID=1114861 RepID=UPI003756C792